MPPNHIALNWLFLWASLNGLNSAFGNTLRYGMRIKPIQKTVPTIPTDSIYCHTCHNKTASLKTKTKSVLPTDIKQVKAAIKHINADKDSIKPENPLVKIQQTASPIYSAFPTHNNASRGATFFFTQLEPHRFEYRAMFQHHDNHFQPFVHSFEPFSRDYPPLPKFPSFPDLSNFFYNNDPFPKLPDFKFPEIKRAWDPVPEIQPPPKPELPPETFNGPVIKDYDVVLGHANYPKIFRFNEERMNIKDFDRQKKVHFYNVLKSEPNSLTETENVKRDHLLILHGGIFTVKEPPLFNKHVKKRRKLFRNHIPNFR